MVVGAKGGRGRGIQSSSSLRKQRNAGVQELWNRLVTTRKRDSSGVKRIPTFLSVSCLNSGRETWSEVKPGRGWLARVRVRLQAPASLPPRLPRTSVDRLFHLVSVPAFISQLSDQKYDVKTLTYSSTKPIGPTIVSLCDCSYTRWTLKVKWATLQLHRRGLNRATTVLTHLRSCCIWRAPRCLRGESD